MQSMQMQFKAELENGGVSAFHSEDLVWAVNACTCCMQAKVKKIKMQGLSDKERINALNEVRILASVKHPNVIAYKEAFIDDDSKSLCLVLEYADDCDLF